MALILRMSLIRTLVFSRLTLDWGVFWRVHFSFWERSKSFWIVFWKAGSVERIERDFF